MNGVSHMLPFVVGGGILIAIAFLLDDYSINPANFGKNTPMAAFFKTVGEQAFGFMLPILAGYIAMSIADRPGLAVGFVGGVIAKDGYCLLYTSILIALLFIGTGLFKGTTLEYFEYTALGKIDATAYQLFFKGILCNILVCSGVLAAYKLKDDTAKLIKMCIRDSHIRLSIELSNFKKSIKNTPLM